MTHPALENLFVRKKRRFALRMAPMIDVIFLLLLFFLVSVKWRPAEKFLPLQIPSAKAGSAQLGTPEPLQIYLSNSPTGCKVTTNSATLLLKQENFYSDLANLTEHIETILEKTKRRPNDPVEIICGPKVKWDHFAKIYNTFYSMGLTEMTFAFSQAGE